MPRRATAPTPAWAGGCRWGPWACRGWQARRNPGVATRTTYDALNNVVGQWSYATSLGSSQVQLVNTVTDPLGNQHVRYFSVATANVTGPGPNLYDYGRPYTPSTPLGSLFLSEQVIDAGGSVRRTDYVRYGRDVVDGGQTPPDVFNNNPREAQRETVYDDGAQAGYTATDFDGVGHYRTRTSDGTFGGNDVRVEKTDFNPNRMSYNVDQASNSFSGGYLPVQPAEPWVLGTSDYEYAQENGVSELRSSCYETATGFLLRRRIYVQSTTDAPRLLDVADKAESAGGSEVAQLAWRQGLHGSGCRKGLLAIDLGQSRDPADAAAGAVVAGAGSALGGAAGVTLAGRCDPQGGKLGLRELRLGVAVRLVVAQHVPGDDDELARHRDDGDIAVLLLGQPAEEVPQGARV
jgi:hypothetical protein